MADLYDQNGDPVSKEDLVRLWTWWPGRNVFETALCLRDVSELVIEEARAQGAHCWATDAVIVEVNY